MAEIPLVVPPQRSAVRIAGDPENEPDETTTSSRRRIILPLLAILLVALTLRAPLTSLPPVISYVSETMRITPTQAGLLTSIPVAFIAALTPVASYLIGRAGIARSVVVALLLLIAGQVVRATGSFCLALVGTAFIGIGIAIGNVALPLLIARDYTAQRKRLNAATVTGGYSAAMNTGSATATALTVPIAHVIGWQRATVLWAVLAAIALVAWQLFGEGRRTPFLDSATEPVLRSPQANRSAQNDEKTSAQNDETREGRRTQRHSAWSRPAESQNLGSTRTKSPTLGRDFAILTALLSVAFIGQSSSYYALTAWLPQILSTRLGVASVAAGGLAMPFQLLGAVGALLVPILVARGLTLRVIAMLYLVFWISLPLGLLFAPGLTLLWVCLSGAAQGGNFVIILTLIANRAPNIPAARRSSTIMQTVGYTSSAIAPTLHGALSTATGGWTIPLLVISAVLAIMGVAMFIATGQERAV